MAASAAARAAMLRKAGQGGSNASEWSLGEAAANHTVVKEHLDEYDDPFPHCVPQDGALADLIKVQMVVFKKHLSRTIMHNDIIAMETLKADFDKILYNPFVHNAPFEMTKRHKPRKPSNAEKSTSPQKDEDAPLTCLDKYLIPCDYAHEAIVHPWFSNIMIVAICIAGVLVGAQTVFDCGKDLNDQKYRSCRMPDQERQPCLAGGSLYNMTEAACAARTCCWKPSSSSGGNSQCWARGLMPECVDSDTAVNVIHWLDMVILVMFTVELILKIMAEKLRPWRYWSNPCEGDASWNTFDSVIVGACWLPGGERYAVLRLARLTRVLKLLDKIEQLKIIMNGLVSGMSSVVYILIMLFLVYYVFAIVCMMFFRDNDPVHFGELHISLVTLFRMSTMEDWTDVMYINMLGCNAYGYKPAGAFCYGFHNFPGNYRYYGAANINDGVLTDYCSKTATATAGVTSLYRGCAAIPDEFITNPELWPDKQWKGMTAAGLFIFFIVIAGLVVMSLFIGVITTSMQIASDEAKEERKIQKQEDARTALSELVHNEAEIAALKLNGKIRVPGDLVDQESTDDAGVTSGYANLAAKANNVVASSWFQNFITGCILLAGLLIGLQTYKTIEEAFHLGFVILDSLILVAFIVEIILKIVACNDDPLEFFWGIDLNKPHGPAGKNQTKGLQAWNIFDFTVVIACLMPESVIPGGGVAALRLLRLLRVLKLLKSFTQLQIILSGLAKGMGSVVWIAVLMAILFYVFACAGISFFRANDPVHFGSLGITFVTLFRCATLEDWTDVMYVAMYGCKQYAAGDDGWIEKCENNEASGMLAACFFIVFILLSSLVMLNLIVGVVCSSMQEATDNHQAIADKHNRMHMIEEVTGVEREILRHWESEFVQIDDSEGFAEGNINKDDLRILLLKLNETDLLSDKGREHLYVKAHHSMPTGKISLLDFLETMAKDLANDRASNERHGSSSSDDSSADATEATTEAALGVLSDVALPPAGDDTTFVSNPLTQGSVVMNPMLATN